MAMNRLTFTNFTKLFHNLSAAKYVKEQNNLYPGVTFDWDFLI